MRKLTTEEFKQRAEVKFGDKFCLDEVNYINGRTDITINCPKHGKVSVKPIEFLESVFGCPLCRLKTPKYLEAGDVFGKLVVMGVSGSSKVKNGKKVKPSKWQYHCLCECGNITTPTKDSLVNHKTKSCGCYKSEIITEFNHGKRKTNLLEVCGDVTKIFFFNAPGEYTTIDTEDYDKVKDYCWHKYIGDKGDIYAKSNTREITPRTVRMLHQIICPCEEGYEPDHIDGNGLNNRKNNLRPLTHQQNCWNRDHYKSSISGVIGVLWDESKKLWKVNLGYNYDSVYVGHSETFEEACQARWNTEEEYFGECSKRNGRGNK
jgi:hypothetical protein